MAHLQPAAQPAVRPGGQQEEDLAQVPLSEEPAQGATARQARGVPPGHRGRAARGRSLRPRGGGRAQGEVRVPEERRGRGSGGLHHQERTVLLEPRAAGQGGARHGRHGGLPRLGSTGSQERGAFPGEIFLWMCIFHCRLSTCGLLFFIVIYYIHR